MDVRQIRERANQFAATHVRELAAEIIEWQDTGLLRNGKLRELAAIWAEADVFSALTVAERTAFRAALVVASQAAEGERNHG